MSSKGEKSKLFLKSDTKKSMSQCLNDSDLGKPIALLCVRFWYRGVLSEIGEDYYGLSFAHCVANAGFSSSPQPLEEEAVPSDVRVSKAAIEMISQPSWVNHNLPTFSDIKKDSDSRTYVEYDIADLEKLKKATAENATARRNR